VGVDLPSRTRQSRGKAAPTAMQRAGQGIPAAARAEVGAGATVPRVAPQQSKGCEGVRARTRHDDGVLSSGVVARGRTSRQVGRRVVARPDALERGMGHNCPVNAR
jgi:hypothetical protein